MDSTQNEECLVCSNGGKLLDCISCSLSVHESCMGCKPYFDDGGNFHCPYCHYRETEAEVRELKEKVMVAKKQLLIFTGESEKDKTCLEDKNSYVGDDVQNHCEGKGTFIMKQTEGSRNKSEENPNPEADNVEADAGKKSGVNNGSGNLNGHPNARVGQLQKERRVNWSEEEVDMLKKGAEKYSQTTKKNLPFDSCRTPFDLKDKWGNIPK